jgi:hypothetical protein
MALDATTFDAGLQGQSRGGGDAHFAFTLVKVAVRDEEEQRRPLRSSHRRAPRHGGLRPRQRLHDQLCLLHSFVPPSIPPWPHSILFCIYSNLGIRIILASAPSSIRMTSPLHPRLHWSWLCEASSSRLRSDGRPMAMFGTGPTSIFIACQSTTKRKSTKHGCLVVKVPNLAAAQGSDVPIWKDQGKFASTFSLCIDPY